MIRQVRRVGSKGQVVIPKPFRDSLGIRPGEDVDITIEEDKVIISRQAHQVKEQLEEIASHSTGDVQKSDVAYKEMRDKRWKKST